MPDSTTITIDPKIPIQKFDAKPGTEIIIHGSFSSSHDGTIIDAVTTTWPKEAPGGASVDPVGIVDLEGGGLHMTSRDITKHEVHAIVTDKPGEACAAAGMQSPCLVLNKQLAVKRLSDWQQFGSTLNGTMTAEIPVAPPPPIVAPTTVPYLQFAGAIVAAGLLGFVGWNWRKRRASSPEGQLIALSRKVMAQLEKADQVVAAPLKPTVDAAVKAIREKRVDAASNAGKRVADALRRVNEQLISSAQEERAAKEQQVADELLREMESALEAAEEMKRSP